MPDERSHATSCVGNCNVRTICRRLRDDHVRTSQYTGFEYLTLKMRVGEFGDLNENRCQYVVNMNAFAKNWRFYVQPFRLRHIIVHFVTIERTYVRTYVHSLLA